MNDTDRKYDYLKTLRWIRFWDNNLNAFLLLLLWLNHLKVAFWILFGLSVFELIGSSILTAVKERELGLQ